MRVAVLDSQVPFHPDAGDELAGALCGALREHGHEAELIRLPFRADPPERVVEQMLAVRLVNLDNVDRAVALRFPAYLLAHGHRAVWLQRRAPALPAAAARSARAAERAFLDEADRLYAPSALSARELASDTGLRAAVLYAPLEDEHAYRFERHGMRLLLVAQRGPTAGVAVAFAALARAPAAQLTLACHPADAEAMLALAGELGARGRIELAELPPGRPIELLAHSRAVVCVERDSEELAREAFRSHKGVIALADCGCAGELVLDGVNGRIVTTLEELAAALEEISQDARLAERYGAAAAAMPRASWENVVAELTR